MFLRRFASGYGVIELTARRLLRVMRMLTLLACGLLPGAFVYSANSSTLLHAEINGGVLEYEVSGEGEPVLLIHGTGVADTFAPTMSEPAMAGYKLIRVHRRGFAGSSRTPVPFTIKDHAADAIALLKLLGVEKAHIVGHSFGGMVTLQFALDAPEMVQSLVVIEPPVFNAEAPPASFLQMEEDYEAGNKTDTMETFSQMSYGTNWRALAASVNPAGPEQVMRDVDTVFQTEVPAMINWGFGEAQAATIKQPIIYVTGGGRHGSSLAQLQEWIPGLESVVVPGVTHGMLMEDPPAAAKAIATFLQRHPF